MDPRLVRLPERAGGGCLPSVLAGASSKASDGVLALLPCSSQLCPIIAFNIVTVMLTPFPHMQAMSFLISQKGTALLCYDSAHGGIQHIVVQHRGYNHN